nr:MAG: zinc-binding loop region of homing endonuclease [Bacteriophage sp.]
MEEFRDIKGYEGLYQVSNLGIVKNIKGRIMKQCKDRYGYLTISLCKEGKHKTFSVHRLVAEEFIPNENNYPCINHKDEDKTNNNVNNLEWCDYKYNSNYGTAIERRVNNTDWKKIVINLSKPVLQYTKNGMFVKEWSSTRECGRNGFSNGAVAACCRGERKSHKGYIWKYKE